MSENISTATSLNGESVTRQPLIKSMRVVKKETLKLISHWVERSNDANVVLQNFIPPLLDAVLLDYQRCTVKRKPRQIRRSMSCNRNDICSTIDRMLFVTNDESVIAGTVRARTRSPVYNVNDGQQAERQHHGSHPKDIRRSL